MLNPVERPRGASDTHRGVWIQAGAHATRLTRSSPYGGAMRAVMSASAIGTIAVNMTRPSPVR